MNSERHEAVVSGRPLSLTPKEFALLRALVEAGGRVLTHAALLERVWGKAHRGDVEYLRVAIRGLRLKIEDDPAHPTIIRTSLELATAWARRHVRRHVPEVSLLLASYYGRMAARCSLKVSRSPH